MAVMLSGVNENRIAQFEARFELQDDGSYLYFHPNDPQGGLPCTADEAARLIGEFANTQFVSVRSMMYWAIGCGAVLGLLEASNTLVLSRWIQYALILAPFPYTLLAWHRASQNPLRFLEGRAPVAPPHSATTARLVRLAALPASLMFTMLGLDAILTYYAAQTGWELDSALIVASGLLMSAAWVLARRERRRP